MGVKSIVASYVLDWAGGGRMKAGAGGGSFGRAVCVEIESCDTGDRRLGDLTHCHGFEFGDERRFLLSVVI